VSDHSDTDRGRQIERLLADLYEVIAVYRQGDRLSFSLSARYEPERSEQLIRDRLSTAGYSFDLTKHDEAYLLAIDPSPSRRIPTLNVVLFLATLFTVYFVPVYLKKMLITESLMDALSATLDALRSGAGLEFALAMIMILTIHEMGHYVAGRRRQIVTSWPYFIPAPNVIGTFGAIIKSKSPFWRRRDLIEIGAAGPIAGWIAAVFWLIYGLGNSYAAPPEAIARSGEMLFSLDGESILMKSLVLALLGKAEPGQYYFLSEAAFAGWVGLLVTAINLLPIGQLDGGHILYGLGKSKQRPFGIAAMIILVVLGFSSPMWWVFAVFGLLFGINHPPTLNDRLPLTRTAILMGIASIVIMILSFTPTPFR